MFTSVRGRITLIATGVVAVALLLAAVLILFMVENDMLETTERALAAELELEASIFDFGTDQYFEFETEGRVYGLGAFLEDQGFAFGSIFDTATGEPIAEVVIDTDRAEVTEMFEPFTGEPISDPALNLAVEELNFDFLDLDGDDGNLLLVGAVARDEVDASLAAVRSALIVIVPLLTAIFGVLIWSLVGRALLPVRAMSNQVQAITSSNLDQRVPVPGGNDEISSLAKLLNGMLARLERGDTLQRQFAADASHELRSPLSSVRAAAEIIERNPASPRSPALAGDIVAESDRMDALIGDLLTLARIDEERAGASHDTIDLSALVADVQVHRHQIEPRIVVPGDRAQIERAIENLVKNGHRHAASTVSVVLRTAEHHGVVYAELCVEDDGAGVPADQRHAIFERFSRLDEARSRDQGGAGLGLALVRAIVARHRGGITVDSSPELGGARFTIHLPLASGPNAGAGSG